jgi:hypothetical protein
MAMKNFIVWITLLLFAKDCLSIATRNPIGTQDEPDPQFAVSNDLLPNHQFVLMGFRWINESSVPCRLIFYTGTTIYWVSCDGHKAIQGDYGSINPKKPIRIKIINIEK